MSKADPVKDPAFQKTLKNLLSMKPKPHSEMKVGKKAKKKSKEAGEKCGLVSIFRRGNDCICRFIRVRRQSKLFLSG
jgi:hypothetical protein